MEAKISALPLPATFEQSDHLIGLSWNHTAETVQYLAGIQLDEFIFASEEYLNEISRNRSQKYEQSVLYTVISLSHIVFNAFDRYYPHISRVLNSENALSQRLAAKIAVKMVIKEGIPSHPQALALMHQSIAIFSGQNDNDERVYNMRLFTDHYGFPDEPIKTLIKLTLSSAFLVFSELSLQSPTFTVLHSEGLAEILWAYVLENNVEASHALSSHLTCLSKAGSSLFKPLCRSLVYRCLDSANSSIIVLDKIIELMGDEIRPYISQIVSVIPALIMQSVPYADFCGAKIYSLCSEDTREEIGHILLNSLTQAFLETNRSTTAECIADCVKAGGQIIRRMAVQILSICPFSGAGGLTIANSLIQNGYILPDNLPRWTIASVSAPLMTFVSLIDDHLLNELYSQIHSSILRGLVSETPAPSLNLITVLSKTSVFSEILRDEQILREVNRLFTQKSEASAKTLLCMTNTENMEKRVYQLLVTASQDSDPSFRIEIIQALHQTPEYIIRSVNIEVLKALCKDPNPLVRICLYTLLGMARKTSPTLCDSILKSVINETLCILQCSPSKIEIEQTLLSLPALLKVSKYLFDIHIGSYFPTFVSLLEKCLSPSITQATLDCIDTSLRIDPKPADPFFLDLLPLLVNIVNMRVSEPLRSRALDSLGVLVSLRGSSSGIYGVAPTLLSTLLSLAGSSASKLLRIKALKLLGQLGVPAPIRLDQPPSPPGGFEEILGNINSVTLDAMVNAAGDDEMIKPSDLSNIVSAVITSLKESPPSGKQTAICRLITFIKSVKNDVFQHADTILEAILELWETLPKPEAIEAAVMVFRFSKKPMFIVILRRILARNSEGHADIAASALADCAIVDSSIRETVIVDLCQAIKARFATQKLRDTSLKALIKLVNCFDPGYTAREIFSSVAPIASLHTEEGAKALDLIDITARRIGPLSSLFANRVLAELEKNKEAKQRFEEALQGEFVPLPDTSIEVQSVQARTSGALLNALKGFKRTSLIHYDAWYESVALAAVDESPSVAIRSLGKLVRQDKAVLDSIFQTAFLSCWRFYTDEEKHFATCSLDDIITSLDTPTPHLRTLVSLMEFMARSGDPIPIDDITSIEACYRCGAISLGLHSAEDGYMRTGNEVYIRLYNTLYGEETVYHFEDELCFPPKFVDKCISFTPIPSIVAKTLKSLFDGNLSEVKRYVEKGFEMIAEKHSDTFGGLYSLAYPALLTCQILSEMNECTGNSERQHMRVPRLAECSSTLASRGLLMLARLAGNNWHKGDTLKIIETARLEGDSESLQSLLTTLIPNELLDRIITHIHSGGTPVTFPVNFGELSGQMNLTSEMTISSQTALDIANFISVWSRAWQHVDWTNTPQSICTLLESLISKGVAGLWPLFAMLLLPSECLAHVPSKTLSPIFTQLLTKLHDPVYFVKAEEILKSDLKGQIFHLLSMNPTPQINDLIHSIRSLAPGTVNGAINMKEFLTSASVTFFESWISADPSQIASLINRKPQSPADVDFVRSCSLSLDVIKESLSVGKDFSTALGNIRQHCARFLEKWRFSHMSFLTSSPFNFPKDSLEVPGTLPRVSLAGISDDVVIEPVRGRPRRITLKGIDGENYQFILFSTSLVSNTVRLMYALRESNLIFKRAMFPFPGLSSAVYNVCPLSSRVSLVNISTEFTFVEALIREKRGSMNIEAETRYLASSTHPRIDLTMPIQRLEVHFEVAKIFPRDDLRKNMWITSKSGDIWLAKVRNYSSSMAAASVTGYLYGIGDRRPGNILVNFSSGKVAHTHFDNSFHRGTKEAVPFRLTPMFERGVWIRGYDGIYGRGFDRGLRVMREAREELIPILKECAGDGCSKCVDALESSIIYPIIESARNLYNIASYPHVWRPLW